MKISVASISGAVSRRQLLYGVGVGMMRALLPNLFRAETVQPKLMSREEIEQLLAKELRTADPAMRQFAADVFEHCVFGHVRPAEPPFRHPWAVPGGGYMGQWLWDTTFLTDLLSILPDQQELLRGIYENYWEFQARWDAAKPAYAHGMVANFIAPASGGRDWRTFPAYSQAPLLAWGVERVYLRNRDLELVTRALSGLEAFHDWYWRERDLDDVGMVVVGSYSGEAREARDETYDLEVDLDTLQMIPHPRRPAGPDNGPWYGDIYIPANTSYLLLSEASLVRLAQSAGDAAMAERRRPILRKGIESMRRYMWDEEQGCFLAVRRGELRKLSEATVGGMVPLYAGIPTRKQAARMAEVLAGTHWNTPVPVPTVDRHSKEYKSDKYWRGDMWPVPTYQTLAGLARYGYLPQAAEMSGRVLDNALKVGISEHYDSQTGTPLGVRNLGMSGVMLTMALEGLSPRHSIEAWRGKA
jgi:hypothetical protein